MADVRHGSPNSSSSSHNTPSDTTTTTTTGFNLNTHDYDGLLKGSSTSLAGITDGRDYVIGGDRHDEGGGGSAAAVGGGGGYYKAVSAAASSSSSANQLDMRNSGARGAAPTMTETVPTALLGSSGLAGPSGSSSSGNIGIPPPRPPAPSDVQVRKMILTGGMGSSDAKLRRFLEHNRRLKDQFDMPRIPVSEASRR